MKQSGANPPAGARVTIRDAARGHWLQFTNPREIVTARSLTEVPEALQRMEARVNDDGLYAAGFVSYEAAPALDSSLVVNDDGRFPLLWFGLYNRPRELGNSPGAPTSSRLNLASNPEARYGLTPALSRLKVGAPAWRHSVSPSKFRAAIARIKRLIRRGDTYQVNYTYRIRSQFAADPWNVFLRLVAAQDAPYGAFVDTQDWIVCSASPELFFRLSGARIECRPMKGTAARGKTVAEDRTQSAALQASEKERAENVMIVDMVRHDLGRIAKPGSVKVTRLCEVEKYPTVWQMTSTVEARTQASVSEIFRALFPAASVTGAPKVRTMEIIADLEKLPRHLYTGTIGFLAPGRRAQFNVAIRTLVVHRPTRLAEYGVGSGITWDSNAEAEWQECRDKAEILYLATPRAAGRPGPQQPRNTRVSKESPSAASQGWLAVRRNPRHTPVSQSAGFSLLETMRWTPKEGYYLLDRHLARLRASARHFGFWVDLPALRRELKRFSLVLGRRRWKIRLVLARNGNVSLQREALPRVTRRPQRVTFARSPIDASDPFLCHKTTNRSVYEAARASCRGCDDVLLFNEVGELTESTIANVALEIEGKLYTPPLSCGLLPGTLRAQMIERRELIERKFLVSKLLPGTRLLLLNSVRGIYRVELHRVRGGDETAPANQR